MALVVVVAASAAQTASATTSFTGFAVRAVEEPYWTVGDRGGQQQDAGKMICGRGRGGEIGSASGIGRGWHGEYNPHGLTGQNRI